MQLTRALRRYVVQLRADGRADSTIAQYERHIRMLDRWLADHRRPRDVEKITHQHLAQFLTSDSARLRPDGKPKRETATNTLRSSLRAFFAYLHAAGWSPRNAAGLVRRAKCACPPPRSLSDDERKRLMRTLTVATGAPALRDHALFHLMLETGIRVGSAVVIERRDVDLDRGEVLIRSAKGNRPTTVTLGAEIVEHLRHYLDERDGGLLFSASRGMPLTTRHVQRRLALWLRRACVRHASPHALRHTFAVRTYDRTRDILRVQRALRHRSLASTAVYVRSLRT